MAERTQWFHGTAARQLVFIEPSTRPSASLRPSGVPNIRLMQKDMYAELTRRRRRAQIAARQLLRKDP